jgi:GH24 family phage-related lysozyme (muramidase)
MAYMEDSALERERIRQRMLQGATPLALGDPTVQQQAPPPPQGVPLPDLQPSSQGINDLSLQQILGSLQLTPRSLQVKDPPPLQVNPLGALIRPSLPAPQQWKNDDSIAKALGNLGSGGGLKAMLDKLQKSRSAPSGTVQRGAELPPPAGTTAAPRTAGPQVQPPTAGPSPQQIIPGLQPPFDASKQVPNAAAVQSYYREQQPGGPVVGVEKPAAPAAAPPAPGAAGAQGDVPPELSSWVMKKENFSPRAFGDYGQTNIGYGTSANGRTTIDEPTARAEMNAELAKHLATIDQLNPNTPPAIRNSLASLGYNTGGSALAGTGLAQAVKNGDWATAKQIFTQYTKAGGQPLHGLDVRRQQEAKAFDDPNFYKKNEGTTAAQDWGGQQDPRSVKVASTDSAVPVQGAPPSSAPQTPGQPATPGEPPGWLQDTLRNDAQMKGAAPSSQLVASQEADPAGYQAAMQRNTNPLLFGNQPTPGAPPYQPEPTGALKDLGFQRQMEQLNPEQSSVVPKGVQGPTPGSPQQNLTGSLAEAHNALNLSPQEQALYQRHLDNLNGPGGVDNPPSAASPQGSRSSLFAGTYDVSDGKTYVLPQVRDGKIVSPEEAFQAAKAEGLDKFPSYRSRQEADARYSQMHDFMNKDTAEYFKRSGNAQPPASPGPTSADPRMPPGNQDLRSSLWAATNSNQPMPPQMTPQMAKALVGAVEAKDVAAVQAPSPGAQPVIAPTDVAPPAPGAPGGPPGASGASGAMPFLPQGNAPMMLPGSQGNPIAMAGIAEPSGTLMTPLQAQQQVPGQLQPPIPQTQLQAWGWTPPDTEASWGGWSGGGFDGGLVGGGE